MTAHVLILGGGPAGTATALALRNHAPEFAISLVESSAYDCIRIGETLPPQVQPLLAHLDIWPAFLERNHTPAFATRAAWGSPEPHTNHFFADVHNRGWHVDRRDFDAFLAAEAAHRDVAVSTKTRFVSSRREDDGRWWVTLRTEDDGSVQQSVDFIVDATGRLAVFARQHGARKIIHDQLVGAACFFDIDGSYSDGSTLVEAGELGWWYSSVLPNAQLVVACMSDADIVGLYRLRHGDELMAMLEQTHLTKQRLAQSQVDVTDADPRIYAAHTQQLDTVADTGWLAVGDAATTFDPLSSQGVFKALRSGIFAAYTVSDHLRGDTQALTKYETFVAREFAAYRETWQEYYDQERRWPNSPFWQRRHAVVPAAD